MPKFRHKLTVGDREVEAIQWTGDNYEEIYKFTGGRVGLFGDNMLAIPTSAGLTTASPFNWIIKELKEEFYPCLPEIFGKDWEVVCESCKSGEHEWYSASVPDNLICRRCGAKSTLKEQEEPK